MNIRIELTYPQAVALLRVINHARITHQLGAIFNNAGRMTQALDGAQEKLVTAMNKATGGGGDALQRRAADPVGREADRYSTWTGEMNPG